jgi:hypothetical protein
MLYAHFIGIDFDRAKAHAAIDPNSKTAMIVGSTTLRLFARACGYFPSTKTVV